MKSLKKARATTSAYHAAHRALAAAPTPAAAAAARAALAAAGDVDAYQAASKLTTARNGASAAWVFSQLTRAGRRPGRGGPPPRVLEVGAVNTRLLSCRWLAVDAIDLVASVPGVKQVDFFDLSPAAAYDAVVCAMVLNCVPTPAARGVMLARLAAHLRGGGMAFVVLPRRCVEACGGETWASFEGAMAAAGLGRIVGRRASPKLAFWALETKGGGGGAGSGDGDGDGGVAAAADNADAATFRVDAGAAARERERLARRVG
jgi:25S rRNA (adenine2142-N1)-methyltransferase